ncbi:ABC transporter permease [Microvirga sp. 3-52]|uniref:ABC transporter permease n=1 Tax=Microvirga sp. 3-52 TaxID=2792425 RepID=UPI001AD2DE73|nr:ABC transporter permease [Microvirga sp. 3-52]MBO1905769.1 ABC transporter permease [Microvirga sp. 3-52]MBS7453134.1 ABC transporter permease [Microvirga sp. 3-52]
MSVNLALTTDNTVARLAPRPSQTQLALDDLTTGIKSWWLWSTMAWQDIRLRYKGSMLGPFWLTISMGIMVTALGVLYSAIWKHDITDFLPYLAIGLLFWNLISSLISDGTQAFIKAEGILLQVKMPVTIHAMRSVVRNLIVFLHNCVVGAAVLLFFSVPQSLYSLVSLIGLVLILLNGFWFTMLVGMMCTRFRDIGPIVASLTQIVFFLTPIIWMPNSLGNKLWVMYLNPAYAFLEIARGPLLGHSIPLPVWAMAFGVTILGFLVTFVFFARFRARLPFWV